VDAGKKVILNGNYTGLSYDTSRELRAYLHLRRPENLQGIALLKRPGIIKTDDFLDCVDKDTPKGTTIPLFISLFLKNLYIILFVEMWSIIHDAAGMTVFVRNFFWEGYGFYSVLKTSEYGGVYFGNGVPNYDIAFSL